MNIDYHAIAPELFMTGTILLVLVFDAFLPEHVAADGARHRAAIMPSFSISAQ